MKHVAELEFEPWVVALRTLLSNTHLFSGRLP